MRSWPWPASPRWWPTSGATSSLGVAHRAAGIGRHRLPRRRRCWCATTRPTTPPCGCARSCCCCPRRPRPAPPASLGADVLDWSPEGTARLVGATVAVQSALLWARRATRPAQHLTTFAGLLILLVGLVVELDSAGAAGVALWLFAAAWLLGGWRGLLPPSEVALALGGFTMLAAVPGGGRLVGVGRTARRAGDGDRAARGRRAGPAARRSPAPAWWACSCSRPTRSSTSSVTPSGCRWPSWWWACCCWRWPCATSATPASPERTSRRRSRRSGHRDRPIRRLE